MTFTIAVATITNLLISLAESLSQGNSVLVLFPTKLQDLLLNLEQGDEYIHNKNPD